MKKKIFVTRRLLKENEEKLKSLFDVTLNKQDKIYTPQEIVPQIMNDNYEIYDEEGIEEIEEKSLHQHSYG